MTQLSIEPPVEYTITDPACREMAGQRVATDQKTILLKPSEAQFFLANGSLTPVVRGAAEPTANA